MTIAISLIVVCLITGLFYLIIRKYYTNVQYILEYINAPQNSAFIKIRGNYIDLKNENDYIHIYKTSDSQWYYKLNNEDEVEIQYNTILVLLLQTKNLKLCL